MNKKLNVVLLAALFVILMLAQSFAQSVPRVTKEEIKDSLDSIVIVDTRRGYDWKSSEFKIKGAIWGDPGKVDEWSKNLNKNDRIVVYCA